MVDRPPASQGRSPGGGAVAGPDKGETQTLLERDVPHRWLSWCAFGPGLLVCLADTDAGCLIVAAQSGARWGYSLLLLQVVLIPILFLAQELTIRLGVYTKQGHTACIRQHFGAFWAWFACIFLVLECVGAMVSEMSGVAAVGELWGMNRVAATLVAAAVVVAVVLLCSYKQIEAIGVTLGLFELTFVFTMFCFHPPVGEVVRGSFTFSTESEYIKLIAANIGAVIMPWMIYFQQSAVVARRLVTDKDLAEERTQTLFGSILTQLVMIGTLVTLAASPHDGNLETVEDITTALSPVLGVLPSKVLVSLGFVGGSLCAAFVVSLTPAWAVCEALDLDETFSLDRPPRQAMAFYGCFLMVVVIGVVVLLMGVDIVKLNVAVELMDGFLMPLAVGFLFVLAAGEALPPEVRLVGVRKYVLGLIFALCSLLSFVSAVYGLFGG